MKNLFGKLIVIAAVMFSSLAHAKETVLLGSWVTNIDGFRTQNHSGVYAMRMTNGFGVTYECLRPNSSNKSSLVCEWYVMIDNHACNTKRDRMGFLLGSGNYYFNGAAECLLVVKQNNVNTSFFRFFDQKSADLFFSNSNNTDAQIAFHDAGLGIQVVRVNLPDVKGVRQVIQNIALSQ